MTRLGVLTAVRTYCQTAIKKHRQIRCICYTNLSDTFRGRATPLGRRFAHFPENSLGSVWQKTVFGCQVELQIMVSQFKVDF